MASNDIVTFYHATHSRSGGVLALLEELGADYRVELLNLKTGDQRKPEYLAINPMGKVPAIRHRGELVTEQVAIFIYLADTFAQAGLAPALDDPLRGPYLRWLVYYAACFEPGVVDRSLKRDSAPAATSPYGDFDTMYNNLHAQIARGPWILGERYTAADVLWGVALRWTVNFGIVPSSPAIADYIKRVGARPGCIKADALDADWIAKQESAAA